MFEIHVTVLSDKIEQFKLDCEEINCKPLLIELQNDFGSYQQLMTSQKFNHSNWSFEIDSVKNKLENKGYFIDRLKVEINPYSYSNVDIKYYETHFRVKATNDNVKLLEKISSDKKFHMSRNVFKNINSDYHYRMATYRTYDLDINSFERTINEFKEILTNNGFQFDKVEVEACIIDTNDSIDQKWLKNIQ